MRASIIAITIMVPITIMMCYMVIAVWVATLLLHLPGWHIAVAPTLFLALVPTSGTLFIAIAIVVTVAIMVSVGMLVAVAPVSVSMSTFGVRAGHQRHAQHEHE